MDEKRSKSVIKVFVDLYNKGLIYRGLRMVNWDPKALTALSTEEVIYREEQSHLFHLKYYVADLKALDNEEALKAEGNIIHKDAKGYYAVVATTRPETIMGDTAMCINPKDPKNQWLKGRKVIVPLVNRVIPVIEDRYVDIEFGTGCLKVTPAHDTNDYMLGKTHNLETIDIFNPDGTISDQSPIYVGMDRMDCRKQIAKDLQEAGLMEKIEDYVNKVGYSERNPDTAIEPRLSLQWFLKMKHFADIALPPVLNGELKFYPQKYVNTYKNWLENIQDWCISRQLWWGHRIPAYFYSENSENFESSEYSDNFVVAETPEKALELARKKSGNASLQLSDLRQEEDALDTWFSSWLWPISLFDGIEHPDNKEIQYYYPTADLVTGPDIIFFWVARMIMAGYEYIGDMPFRNVYFTGIVRDKLGRKMSKSLGNSPDPIELIEKFGADGVRMGILLSAPAGNDILYDDSLCEQGRNFCNKIWNCFRMIKGLEVADIPQPETSKYAIDWFDAKLAETEREIADLFSKYRLSEALMEIYKLYCDEFSGWYLEMIKPGYQQPIDKATYEATLGFFDRLLRLLHPFMPFITEELWHGLEPSKAGCAASSIMCTRLEPVGEIDSKLLAEVEHLKEIITNIRAVRASKNIPQKERLTLISPVALNALVDKLANVEVAINGEVSGNASKFIVGTTEFAIPMDAFINVEEELKKLEADLAHQQGFLRGVMAKLSNERFVQNAKPEIVALEQKKKADAEARIEAIQAAIAALKA
jgi:valyl-tRNA synthetase